MLGCWAFNFENCIFFCDLSIQDIIVSVLIIHGYASVEEIFDVIVILHPEDAVIRMCHVQLSFPLICPIRVIVPPWTSVVFLVPRIILLLKKSIIIALFPPIM